MKATLFLLCAFLCALLAGCNGRTSYGVEISDQRPFTPSSLNVMSGTTVVFKNASTVPQTVTAKPRSRYEGAIVRLPDGAAALESGILYPGETYSYTFDVPGTYVYISRFPKDRYDVAGAPNNRQDNTPIGLVHVSDNADAQP